MRQQEINSLNRESVRREESDTQGITRLLRGEMSAVEAYKKVMDKITETPERTRLQEFLMHHEDLVYYWRSQLAKNNVEVKTDSGVWGTFVDAVVGTAKIFGNSAALKALKEGEEHGLKEYHRFLNNQAATTEQMLYVKNSVIPTIDRHLNSIDAMMRIQ